MKSLDIVQNVQIPEKVCKELLEHVRENCHKFKRVNQEEEPPLRTLDHGLFGEYINLAPDEEASYPYVIRTKDNKCYLRFRFDQDVSHEEAYKSDFLLSRCGPNDPNCDASFRQVLTYQGGNSEKGDIPETVMAQLKDLLLPAVLKVFGEENNEDALKYSRMFSIYANLLFPGHNIKMHLDVPQFLGVDRSTTPSWLLIAARCSGLFSKKQVRNVTCVHYPQDLDFGGELLVFGTEPVGKIYPVSGGTTAVLDTDSLNHMVAQVRGKNDTREEIIPGPDFPTECRVEVEESVVGYVWSVLNSDGKVVHKCKESEVRFSVSIKFHVFANEDEAKRFDSNSETISAEEIIDVLTKDLVSKGVIQEGKSDLKLFDLAPIFVKEYIIPHAPSSDVIENTWKCYE